ASGVTIILTTHYIDEAEEMADRIAVINRGEIVLVEGKTELMRKLGKKQLTLQLHSPLVALPSSLAAHALELHARGLQPAYSYGAFIVPGLMMLSLLTESIGNASFGIYFPRFVGTIYEVLSAPVSAAEILLGYVGAAATKSVMLGFIILATAAVFVPLHIEHP